MSPDGPRVRSRRTARPGRAGRTVAVTGAASGPGLALARRLAERREGDVRVVGLDAERGPLPDVTWRLADVLDPALVRRLTGVHVLVHLADVVDGLGSEHSEDRHSEDRHSEGRHSEDRHGEDGHGEDGHGDRHGDRRRDAHRALAPHERIVRGAQTVLTAAAAAGVRRVVLVTSAMVYGAQADNPVPLAEDAPLRAVPDGSYVGALLEVEQLAERAARTHPGLAVTVVRPAALVGPGVDTVVTRHFEAPRLLVIRGARIAWQFCHVDDLVSALELAALEQVTDAFAVGCDGWLEQEEVERISGLRRIELPPGLAFSTAERLHRLGVLPAPPTDLSFVVSPWVVDAARLRAAGWKPTFDNATALGVLLDEVRGHHAVAGRRVGRKDATIGAAGAAVAVVGTAALVRRARRRRRLGS